MPGHKTHDAFVIWTSALTTVPVASAAWAMGADQPALLGAGYLLGGLSGLLLTPDLDVDQGCASFWWAKRLFGKAIGYAWEVYWLPYGIIFKHRGLSHTPVIGTLTRIFFGCIWLWPILLLPIWMQLGWVLGLMVMDTVHASLDTVDKLVGGRLE